MYNILSIEWVTLVKENSMINGIARDTGRMRTGISSSYWVVCHSG